MSSPGTLVVLAGGVGSRYGGDKQLAGVGPSGEILSDYTLHDVSRAGLREAVFVIRPELEETFRAHHDRWRDRLAIQWVHQRSDDLPVGRQRPWGTTHALLAAAPLVGRACLVVNADDFYGRDALTRAVGWMETAGAGAIGNGAAAAVTPYRLQDTLSPHGDVSRALVEQDAGGRLVSIVESHGLRSAPDANALVSMNCWVFTRGVLPLLAEHFEAFLAEAAESPTGECALPDTVQFLLGAGRMAVDVLPWATGWLGITHPMDYGAVRQALAALVTEGAYPTPL